MNTAFRDVDIDKYDEDVLQDSELYEADRRGPAEVLEDAKQKQTAVRSFLARYYYYYSPLLPQSLFGNNNNQLQSLN